jgi:hypothetical protein
MVGGEGIVGRVWKVTDGLEEAKWSTAAAKAMSCFRVGSMSSITGTKWLKARPGYRTTDLTMASLAFLVTPAPAS